VRESIQKIQPFLDNKLKATEDLESFCGIFGDQPSKYAKSPGIWNAVFTELSLPVKYLSFDVDSEKLEPLVGALRQCGDYLGGNVTVPHKVSIMPYLDEVDDKAGQIGAVNTVVREPDGRLVGYNTDGKGALDAVTTTLPGESGPLISSIGGIQVLLIGAGGAARAVAVYMAEAIGPFGKLVIANRSAERGRQLAESVNRRYGNTEAITWGEIPDHAIGADLIIQGSVVGQSGVHEISPGQYICLEPYSPLGEVEAPALVKGDMTLQDFSRRWMMEAQDSVLRNNEQSMSLACVIPDNACFFDMIYAPFETSLLRHARLTGHRCLNGKAMNVLQASEGFVNRVIKGSLEARGLSPDDGIYQRVTSLMYECW